MAGIGGALAGAAKGVQDEWEARREIEAKRAQQSFLSLMQESSFDNARVVASEQAGYDAIAADKLAKSTAANKVGDRAFEAEQNRLSNEAKVNAAAARAGGKAGGKLPPEVKLAMDEIKILEAKAADGGTTPEDTQRLSMLRGVIDKYSPKSIETPQPTQADERLMSQNIGNLGAEAGFAKQFGQPALDAIKAKSAQNAATKTSHPQTGGATSQPQAGRPGMLAAFSTGSGGADKAISDRTRQSPAVMATIKQALAQGEPVDNYIKELSEISQNSQLEIGLREEAIALLGQMKNPLRY